MDKNKKPKWLLDAEKELKKFNDSKWANMPDHILERSRVFRDAEAQSAFGKKGGTTTASKRKEEGYFQSEEHRKYATKGAKITGDNNVKSGWINELNKLRNTASHKHVTCPVCGCTGSKRNMSNNHFDKCHKPIIAKYIESCLPEEEDFSITPLIKKLMKKTGLTQQPVKVALKRFFLVPGAPSRYAKWRYQPLKDGEKIREGF